MTSRTSLRGGCSCGRNRYTIFPLDVSESLEVLFDDRSNHSELSLLNLITLFSTDQVQVLSLRVPLSQIQSTTYAFYPDETHSSIRRVFTPNNAPHTKRHFCGFCGTPLSHWSEETEDEAEFVYVNIGSLKSDSVEKLEEEGLLSNVEATNPEPQRPELHRGEVTTSSQQREVQGNPWFEEMIEGSELGRINRKRGGRSSTDGRSKVEWEVVEFSSEPRDTSTGTGKRKLDQTGPGRDDVEMNTG
ncbi:MAG: hypothetical protein Q9214_002190 [Letrouitia sp. 1 TL-2023]